ncbi:MAG: hypothetical protein HYU77_09010 [Betaproteobacteria bacterium]|nr:hypothetical protein [Betaproteobacteria bacterium]
MSDPLRTRLSAARTRLILEKPFIGALVMHLPLTAADPRWCPTVATDARALYYNPRYVAALTVAELQFLLAHEALHCALAHFARRAHRVKKRWDVACDYAVNQLLADEGLRPPAGALINPAFRGLTAEEIYPLIPLDTGEMPIDRHAFDAEPAGGTGGSAGAAGARSGNRGEAGSGETGELAGEAAALEWAGGGGERKAASTLAPADAAVASRASAECENLALAWRERLAMAAQQARQAGRLDESWLRAVDHLIQPQLSWRSLLARYLMSLARNDYTYLRPSRREGEAILPRLAGHELDLVVALDTSGSIGEAELGEFASELDALKGQVRARVTLLACDQQLAAGSPWVYEPWEALTLPRALKGGGGTRFTPVFDWVEREGRRPDLLVYFTDAEGEFPQSPPGYPVIWLVKGRAPVPWGERIQLN